MVRHVLVLPQLMLSQPGHPLANSLPRRALTSPTHKTNPPTHTCSRPPIVIAACLLQIQAVELLMQHGAVVPPTVGDPGGELAACGVACCHRGAVAFLHFQHCTQPREAEPRLCCILVLSVALGLSPC